VIILLISVVLLFSVIVKFVLPKNIFLKLKLYYKYTCFIEGLPKERDYIKKLKDYIVNNLEVNDSLIEMNLIYEEKDLKRFNRIYKKHFINKENVEEEVYEKLDGLKVKSKGYLILVFDSKDNRKIFKHKYFNKNNPSENYLPENKELNTKNWKVQKSLEPDDILYKNLSIRHYSRVIRIIITTMISLFLNVFSFIIIFGIRIGLNYVNSIQQDLKYTNSTLANFIY
jgi:hypothetical protein